LLQLGTLQATNIRPGGATLRRGNVEAEQR